MLDLLSSREQEIFELVQQNKSNQEIAEVICMSEHTVKKDLRSIYAKLGVSSREPSESHIIRRKIMLEARHEVKGDETEIEVGEEKKYSLEEIRAIAKELFPDKRIRVVNDLLSFIKIAG